MCTYISEMRTAAVTVNCDAEVGISINAGQPGLFQLINQLEEILDRLLAG